MRRLGANQERVLDAVRRRGGWYSGCGWTWVSDVTMTRHCRRLVQLGYLSVEIERTRSATTTVYRAVEVPV